MCIRDSAIDHLFPGTGNHGELAGMGALFASHLRGEDDLSAYLDACLRRHGLPRTPDDLGLSDVQFAQAVVYAPATRPDRFTIVEHLDLDEDGARRRVREYVDSLDR